jgi:hypothetical protein
VHIARRGSIGVESSAVVHIWQRCKDGVVVAETVVEVNQPGAGGGVSAGDFGMVCDGRWHRIDVTVSSTSGSPFVPGLADVDARFTVLDPESFDPLPQGVDSRRVWLQAPAQVFVFWRGALDEAGNASVAVVARCQPPWTVALLSLELTQGGDALLVRGVSARDHLGGAVAQQRLSRQRRHEHPGHPGLRCRLRLERHRHLLRQHRNCRGHALPGGGLPALSSLDRPKGGTRV